MSHGSRVTAVSFLLIGSSFILTLFAANSIKNLQPYSDPTGTLKTYSTQGSIDLSNAFFQPLGTNGNGRSCASCHMPSDAWSVSAEHLKQRFDSTNGLDPIFQLLDGANCPTINISTLADPSDAYSLLLTKGLIRMSLPVPADSEFTVTVNDDPYECSATTNTQLSLYRRPLPSTNLPFLPAIMWDGRESDLATQANNAAAVHAVPETLPTATQLQQIESFETSLFTAQSDDKIAGSLTARGADGGPKNLAGQNFFPGINPDGVNVFTLYTAWTGLSGSTKANQQGSIAHGEMLFNNRPIRITGVAGFNDVRGEDVVSGTCGTCHNSPNVGSSSSFAMMNIGTATVRVGLPTYALQCSGGTQIVSDPGRAMVTGKCVDIGKFKVPSMRGLAARAPYFHDGSALTLGQVVDFYDQRFGMLLSPEEKADLVAFMNSL
jgi:cytochrome c peroxidase